MVTAAQLQDGITDRFALQPIQCTGLSPLVQIIVIIGNEKDIGRCL